MARNNLELVMKGFKELSSEDKARLIQRITEWQRGGVLNERVEKGGESINMGPVGGSCPCCGR